ncbi:MAG: hypothetical protein IJR61_05165 [Clostridia bacterium]|nr:hypothetical protein [Clostridia bacterium]
MKKLLIALIIFISAFSFAACSRQTVTYSPEKPYWLKKDSYGNSVSAGFSETCRYSVTHKDAETPNANVTAEYSDDCSYTVELTSVKYPADGDSYKYLLTTTYDMRGKYIIGETEYPFEDLTVYRTYFTWDSGFNFVYSEQEAQSTLPVNATGATDDKGNAVCKIGFRTTVTYEGNNATTTFNITEGDPSYFALKDGFSSTFKKYNKNNYIDTNLLSFAVRSFDFADELNYSFSSIDALSNTKHNMQIKVNEATTINAKNLIIENAVVGSKQGDEDRILNQDAYSVSVKLNETYNGTAMTCVYFKNADTYHHYLYSMSTVLPYSLGSLEYTLVKVDRTE